MCLGIQMLYTITIIVIHESCTIEIRINCPYISSAFSFTLLVRNVNIKRSYSPLPALSLVSRITRLVRWVRGAHVDHRVAPQGPTVGRTVGQVGPRRQVRRAFDGFDRDGKKDKCR